jgi:hypothetical protein
MGMKSYWQENEIDCHFTNPAAFNHELAKSFTCPEHKQHPLLNPYQ